MQAIPFGKKHLWSKAVLEIALGVMLFFSYVWCVYPERTSWEHVVFLMMILGLLIYSKQSRGETWKNLGIRFDNWTPPFKKLLMITLPVIIILSVIWSQIFTVNIIFYKQTDFWIKLAIYPLWAFVQQYIALAFFFRRLREVFFPHFFSAIFLSAILFSAAHLPNIPLVIFSFFGGALWAWIYHKYNNVIIIILFHAMIGTFLSTILMMNLSIGPWTDTFRLTKTTPVYYSVDTINGKTASSKYWPIEISKTDIVITANGWVAGKQLPVKQISILINGNEFGCKYGIKRKDVAEAFDNPAYEYSGFHARIPISDIKPGYYYLRLKISLQGMRFPHYPSKKIWINIRP